MLPITESLALPDPSVRHEKHAGTLLQEVLANRAYLLFDGGMGTMLQRNGLAAGELPELLCLEQPEEITAIHRAYVEAGSNVVTTNTFGANRAKLAGAASVEDVFSAAIACAKAANPDYVAADIGPTGALLEPLGTMSFDEAYELFAEQVRAADAAGADLFIIETMSDLLEMKAAILAAKENSSLPIFATMTFGEDGRTFLGTTPAIAARTIEALDVDALGINCSLGPAALAPLVSEMLAVTSKPVIIQANAGLPNVVDGQTVYSIRPDEYAEAVASIVDAGANIIGGCCGTDPDYIRALANVVASRTARPRQVEKQCSITSSQSEVVFNGRNIAVIGERINPTGKKRLKEALRACDYNYVAGEAIAQMQAGADILDVNAGLPELDEPDVLAELVKRIQGVCPLPLQADSTDPRAIEAAVRAYAGKPLINSVNGKRESLDSILPIAAHYGCAVVGLTLDEDGIPSSAEGRYRIAERIVKEAEERGVPRTDIFIDCLVMSASTNQAEVVEILRAVTLVKERLGVKTVLGASNVSFGLPARPVLNATFLAAAFAAGLDAPITNPLDDRLKETIDSWKVLCGQDEGAPAWIEGYADWTPGEAPAKTAQAAAADGSPAQVSELHELVLSGVKGPIPEIVNALLADTDPMDIVNNMLIPALDEVGNRFEAGKFFLPQLMASAEAAKAGFDTIREYTAKDGQEDAGKGPIVLATVKGDIHDIGKNIVRMLLGNYGYHVIDLGRDVDPQVVVDAALANNAPLVGLSALMTTTVRSMEETIALLHEQAPQVKVFVGGAVLNPEYAEMVGADYYAKDAAESARIAAEVIAG